MVFIMAMFCGTIIHPVNGDARIVGEADQDVLLVGHTLPTLALRRYIVLQTLLAANVHGKTLLHIVKGVQLYCRAK